MAGRGGKSMPEKQRTRLKIRPRTNLNGGDLVRSTFLVLTFTFTLAFMATLVLGFILAFLSPFGGSISTLLWCNGEKRSILSQGGGIPFGALGTMIRIQVPSKSSLAARPETKVKQQRQKTQHKQTKTQTKNQSPGPN